MSGVRRGFFGRGSRLASLTRVGAVVGLAAVLAACEGLPKASETTPTTEPPKRTGPAVAVLDLTAGAPEQEKTSLLGGSSGKGSFDELLRTIDGLKKDKRSVAVLVKFGSASIGAARAQELALALESLREAKKVTCHAEGYTNATLMTAIRGCSSIWIAPAGGVESIGLASQVVYLRRLLVDELHLSIDMLQVGKFKGAEEPLTRDGPSPEARKSLEGVMRDLRASWLETIGTKRRLDPAVLEDGPWTPEKAKQLGIVDAVGYADDASEALHKESGAVRDVVVYGAGAEEQEGDLGDLVRALAGESSATGPVALVRASGSISMSGGGNGLFGGRGGIVEREFSKTIARLEKDDDVKAVVVRIDSPGGSALASDLMWHELLKLRKKKPLVFSVGDMAASGGYYLSCTGDYIFAEPMSIVGSIGVVGGKIGGGEALEKIGVHTETFPASDKPGAAARAAYESPLVKWDDATRARVLESMTGIYDLFLARVAEGRSTRGRTITREKVGESAEGRIFGGREGKARGLVDEIGGLSDAIAKARELAELPKDARVAVVSGKGGLLDALGGGGAEEKVAAKTSPLALVERTAPNLLPFVGSLAPLAEGERAVVAVPFGLSVR